MIDTQLKDYIKVYKQFYKPDFCKNVVASLANIKFYEHRFSNQVSKTYSYEGGIQHTFERFPLRPHLDSKIRDAINRYILQDMGHMGPWFGPWNAHTPAKINKYVESAFMKVHCDHIHSIFDGKEKGIPILTILGVLNEDFEGGELLICGEQIEFKTGDVVVFPSNFLYPHEIKPIKSGIRYSFASWAW